MNISDPQQVSNIIALISLCGSAFAIVVAGFSIWQNQRNFTSSTYPDIMLRLDASATDRSDEAGIEHRIGTLPRCFVHNSKPDVPLKNVLFTFSYLPNGALTRRSNRIELDRKSHPVLAKPDDVASFFPAHPYAPNQHPQAYYLERIMSEASIAHLESILNENKVIEGYHIVQDKWSVFDFTLSYTPAIVGARESIERIVFRIRPVGQLSTEGKSVLMGWQVHLRKRKRLLVRTWSPL